MNNSDMKANRFGRWAAYRKMVANIKETLAAGGIVQIPTYTRCTNYDKRHVDMFKATKSGAWVQRGKNWDCLNLSKIIHRRAA